MLKFIVDADVGLYSMNAPKFSNEKEGTMMQRMIVFGGGVVTCLLVGRRQEL